MPVYIVCDSMVRMPQAGAADETDVLIEVGSETDICPVCFQPVAYHERRAGPAASPDVGTDDDSAPSRPWP